MARIPDPPEHLERLKNNLTTFIKKVLAPKSISENEDLNDYTEVGVYYCNLEATGLGTLINAPSDVTSGNGFCLFVENSNVYDNGVKQTLTTFAKSNTFVRNFWTDFNEVYHTTGWQPVYEDTGWKNVTYQSGYQDYDTTHQLRYRRIGKVVHIEGIFKNNSAISSGASPTFANISDTSCRPSKDQYQLQQGSSKNFWLLQVQTNGNLTLSRYGTTANAQANAGAWLHCYITYFVD